MDVQYFSKDAEDQSSQSIASSVKRYISDSASYLGKGLANQLSTAAAAPVHNQKDNHTIEGVLVLTATCTHRQALMMAPFYLNVDKGIQAWNRLFPKDQFDPDKPDALFSLLREDNEQTAEGKAPPAMQIISGVTFASSFVGTVFVLNTTDTSALEKIKDKAQTLKNQIANLQGGFGVSDTTADAVKKLLSTQKVTSHCAVVCMGIMPSIVANSVKIAVQQFATFDPKQLMDQLAALATATASELDSMENAANFARTGAKLIELEA